MTAPGPADIIGILLTLGLSVFWITAIADSIRRPDGPPQCSFCPLWARSCTTCGVAHSAPAKRYDPHARA